MSSHPGEYQKISESGFHRCAEAEKVLHLVDGQFRHPQGAVATLGDALGPGQGLGFEIFGRIDPIHEVERTRLFSVDEATLE